jgi:1-deoxy-D-xylulose-5-phosphate reductoisomerase
MKNVVLLGSSGSIGRSTLRVARALPAHLRVVGLSVHRNYRCALRQAAEFGVRHVGVGDPSMARRCAREAPAGVRVYEGPDGLESLASLAQADVVLCAIVGMAALRPALAAVRAGIDLALASKEVLVAAGAIVTDTARREGARILPVDSEHSAIFQCLSRHGGSDQAMAAGTPCPDVKRLILTASGGPFAFRPEVDLGTVTVDEALAHPRWYMGRKVTVDSATLMNKGLEIMEAHWLFGMPVEAIDVVLHPESIVHSMVEFVDGSVLAQLSLPDMRFAIQYALTCPQRVAGRLPRLDLVKVGALTFREPNGRRFPCLGAAREAARIGGTMPAVLNAANEVAVAEFLEGRISFSGIWKAVARVMNRHRVVRTPSLAEIAEADAWARREVAGGGSRKI